MVTEVDKIVIGIKNEWIGKLISIINRWFNSDAEIGIMIEDGNRKLLCVFESNVFYYKSRRFEGEYRNFVGYKGDNGLYRELKDYCNHLYSKQKMIDLIYELVMKYKVKPVGYYP